MIGAMRTKMGPKVIGAIIAVIAFVFIFYGIFTPGGGSQAPSIAGEVNGETITYPEFSRALTQRVEFFKNLMGGKVSEEQITQFHIREAVFQDLAQKKVLGQVAKKEGFYPSAEQIRDQILKMDVFKKDGHFDKMLYKNVLTQNQYSPARFEEMIGQDIMDQNFRNFIGSLAYVSNDEIEKELKASKDKRKVKYVYVDNESVRKLMPLTKEKMKPEEQAKVLDQTAEKLSQEILPALSANQEGKINSALKGTTVKVKTSDWLNAQSEVIPGVGSIASIKSDLFAMKKGEPAKKFALMGGTLYAMVTDLDGFDASKVTAKEKAEMLNRLQYQKQSEILAELVKSWSKKASIQRNDKVVVGGQGQALPVTMDN
jgi:flagellar motility protein MotE (MotC chaperone)